MLSIIVAADRQGVIGYQGEIPWQGQLPRDMEYFRDKTIGHPVIMGRKTWESLPERFRPLPGRENIVLSRNQEFRLRRARVYSSLKSALCDLSPNQEIFVIGGEQVFQAALPLAGRIYLTRVEAEFPGDAHFHFDEDEWFLVWARGFPADEENKFPIVFRKYQLP